MRTPSRMRILLVPALLTLVGTTHSVAATLEIVATGLKRSEGRVHIAVWASPATFMTDPLRVAEMAVPAGADSVQIQFEGLPSGKVAVHVFQDLNGNQRLDTGLNATPREPHGFSRGARGDVGPPTFNEAAFTVAPPLTPIEITLK